MTPLWYSVLLGLGLLAVFWRRLHWGVYALAATLPLEWFGSWALDPASGHPVVRLSQIIGFALVLAYFGRATADSVTLRRPPAAWWILAAFGLSAGLSALLVGHGALLNGWVALVFMIALTYVLASLADRLTLQKLTIVLLLSAGAVSVFGLYQFIAGSAGLGPEWTGLRPAYERQVFGFPRVQSTALEPLYFANYLLLPLIVGLLLLANGQMRLIWQRLVLGVIGLAFVLTMSRGAFIGLAVSGCVGGLWLAASQPGRSLLRRVWQPVVAGMVVTIVAGLLLVGVATKISRGSFLEGPRFFVDMATSQLTATSSFHERSQMRQAALAIYSTHPIWGVGVAGISPYLHSYPDDRQPGDIVALNSQAFELLAETGLVGTSLFYGFLIALLAGAIQAWRRTNLAWRSWIAGLSLVILAMTVQAQSFSGFLLTHFWFCYGLLAGLSAIAPATQPRAWHIVIDGRSKDPVADGLPSSVDMLANQLALADPNSHFTILVKRGQKSRVWVAPNVALVESPAVFQASLRGQFQFMRLLYGLRPDLIHFRQSHTPWLWIGRRCITLDHPPETRGAVGRLLAKLIVGLSLAQASCVVAPDKASKRRVQLRHGLRGGQILLAPLDTATMVAAYRASWRRLG